MSTYIEDLAKEQAKAQQEAKEREAKIYAKNVEIASQNKNLSKQKKIEHKLFIKNIKTDIKNKKTPDIFVSDLEAILLKIESTLRIGKNKWYDGNLNVNLHGISSKLYKKIFTQFFQIKGFKGIYIEYLEFYVEKYVEEIYTYERINDEKGVDWKNSTPNTLAFKTDTMITTRYDGEKELGKRWVASIGIRKRDISPKWDIRSTAQSFNYKDPDYKTKQGYHEKTAYRAHSKLKWRKAKIKSQY